MVRGDGKEEVEDRAKQGGAPGTLMGAGCDYQVYREGLKG